jgi:hypothetical protein
LGAVGRLAGVAALLVHGMRVMQTRCVSRREAETAMSIATPAGDSSRLNQ